MGATPSRQRDQPAPPPAVPTPPQYYPPPQQYQTAPQPAPYYTAPEVAMNTYNAGGYQYSNGAYYGGYAHAPYPPANPYGMFPQPSAGSQYGQGPQTAPQPTSEYQQTATIRNQVNLKKPTLKLECLPESSTKLSIKFSFDASAPCRVTTFVMATEDTKKSCMLSTARQAPGTPVSYPKGLDLKFPPQDPSVAEQHVIDTSAYDIRELQTQVGDTYPLVVRLESITEEGRRENYTLDSLEAGRPLPNWVQSQTTYAKLVREDDGSWDVRIVRQKIWVKGVSYELQEIYGMEQNRVGNKDSAFEDVEGKDCVICMNAERDTTVLPCRHMCMCNSCARALKTQTNKCPICRNEIESLLHIKIQPKSKENEVAV